MAELPRMRDFVVAVEPALFHEFFDRRDEGRRPIGMDGTDVGIDDTVGALGIEADDVFAVHRADGQLQLVAVAILRLAPFAGGDFRRDAAQLFQGIADERRLKAELHAVRHVLELAASAARKDGAGRAHPVLCGRQKLFHFGIRRIPLDFEHLDARPLPRKEIGDKERRAVVAGDPLSVRPDRIACDGQDVVFLQHALTPF